MAKLEDLKRGATLRGILLKLRAMSAVMEADTRLGFHPRDVHGENLGYDIESEMPRRRALRLIEVKGRAMGAATVTVTRKEIMCTLNKPEEFILAIGLVDGDQVVLKYVRQPFAQEPEFGTVSINYDIKNLWNKGLAPT